MESLKQDLKYCHSKGIDEVLIFGALMSVLVEAAVQAKMDPKGIHEVLDETLDIMGRTENGAKE